jgi:hypothetical protein
MIKLNINIGDKYGRLTILKEVEPKSNLRYFQYKCECGKERIGQLSHLRNGLTQSCGCYRIERRFIDGDYNQTNKTEFYYISKLWTSIKTRCYNKKSNNYKYYGGRGIEMYKPWIKNRPLFNEWILNNLGHRPEGYSIDRINVDGNYEPDNLRWADKTTQNKNRRCVKNG